ncbi:hypothetical protein RCIA199 [Methanocella arvoryzae MRE50]|uniref:Uncharacterized protein n=1 Tax=Methanocella arvoryzae (strain DSM 22066 / NBRC 105507 / MRE50) TaxID=351160 RepID=Q0W1M6_METAR|nr:hypothetical protein RCIA199 [Methanocella arvoryzae MRE50]
MPGGPGDFSNWEVREVRRSERRNVSTRRIGEGKSSVMNRLLNACHGRRSQGEYPGKGTVQKFLDSQVPFTRSTRSFTIGSFPSMPFLPYFEYFVYFA